RDIYDGERDIRNGERSINDRKRDINNGERGIDDRKRDIHNGERGINDRKRGGICFCFFTGVKRFPDGNRAGLYVRSGTGHNAGYLRRKYGDAGIDIDIIVYICSPANKEEKRLIFPRFKAQVS
ncbi:MAG: hypothetical protein IJS94_04340, partial [Clostridia bacterium]|nr:hypothetical protein [Clostridia bacterium]